MKVFKVGDMVGGWFAGDFSPTCMRTKHFEAACKYYKSGDNEKRHFHKVATEITVIASGAVRMNGVVYGRGDIIIAEPGDSFDFCVLEDCVTMVVKSPSVPGDKYLGTLDARGSYN